MSKYLITVCIPTFNAERTLSYTLDSLFAQTYKNFKIKVFDNASTDNTAQIVKEYQNKYPEIELHIHEQNIGGEANFTHCLNAGEGDFTAVFHSDDIYDSHMLEESLKVFQTDKTIVAVSTHAKRIDFDHQIIGERFLPPAQSQNDFDLYDYRSLLKAVTRFGNFITCPSVIAKTDVYKNKIKNWNGAEFKTSADLDVWLRLAQEGKFAFLRKPLILYREAVDSYSYNLKKVRVVRHDIFPVLEAHFKKSGVEPQFDHYFNFLEFKDRALRTYNIVRSKSEAPLPQLFPWNINLIKVAFSDTWHLKFYCLALGIWFYKILKFRF